MGRAKRVEFERVADGLPLTRYRGRSGQCPRSDVLTPGTKKRSRGPGGVTRCVLAVDVKWSREVGDARGLV